jgi:divalent metal cation (Fe/Co/Zn/Cd) transporter
VWQTVRAVVTRMLDGVDPAALDEIDQAARHVPGVEDVSDVRAHWIGHRLHADVSVAVSADLSVARGHEIARDVRHQLLHHLPHLGSVMLHVDPVRAAGETRHRIEERGHDGLPPHMHP